MSSDGTVTSAQWKADERARNKVARGLDPNIDYRHTAQRKRLAPCGTRSAYNRHLREGESCTECKAKNAQEVATYRAKKAGKISKKEPI